MKKTTILLFVFMMLLGYEPVHAQWNPANDVNTRITPADMPDGGCYHVETNKNGVTYALMEEMLPDYKYAAFLQIIDKDGVKLFEDKGFKICEESNISYIDLLPGNRVTIDNEGNAIIALNDQRTGGYSYTLYKFDENGNKLWGDVQLYNAQSLRRASAISICQTTDGGYMAAYMGNVKSNFSKDPFVAVEKIDKDGNFMWDEPLKLGFADGEEICNSPYLVDAGMNQCFLVYSKGANQNIMARLIDFDGSSAWGEDIEIYTGGCWGTMPLYLMLRVGKGPDNGLMVSWRDMRPKAYYQNSLSYITNDGTYGFSTGIEGTLVSNAEGYSKYQAEFFVDEKDHSTYCLYKQYNQSLQEFNGVFMQKISKEGELLWGAEGKTIVEIQKENSNEFCSIKNIDDNRFAVFYQEGPNGDIYGKVNSYVIIYDKEGNQISDKYNFTTSNYGKIRLHVSDIIDGKYFIASWDEYRVDSEDGNVTHGDLCSFMQYIELNEITTGINSVDANNESEIVKTEIFTLSGKQIEHVADGVNIIRTTYADGKVTVNKITR